MNIDQNAADVTKKWTTNKLCGGEACFAESVLMAQRLVADQHIAASHKLRSDTAVFENVKAFGDGFGVDAFFSGDLERRSSFEPRSWDQSDGGEEVGFGFFAGLAADAVEIGGNTSVGCVHQEMSKFVKHHKQLFVGHELAIDRDIMPTHQAIIKSADAKRHFLDRYLMPPAKRVKIGFGQPSLVPANLECFDLFEEKTHNVRVNIPDATVYHRCDTARIENFGSETFNLELFCLVAERSVENFLGVANGLDAVGVCIGFPTLEEDDAEIGRIFAAVVREPFAHHSFRIAEFSHGVFDIKWRRLIDRSKILNLFGDAGRKFLLYQRSDPLIDQPPDVDLSSGKKHLAATGKQPIERHVRFIGDLDQDLGCGQPALKIISDSRMRQIKPPGNISHCFVVEGTLEPLYEIVIHSSQDRSVSIFDDDTPVLSHSKPRHKKRRAETRRVFEEENC